MEGVVSAYANSLLSIAIDENKNKIYREHVKNIYSTFEQSDDLLLVLKSSFISKSEKLDLFKEILKDEELIYVRDFILVILTNNRGDLLLDILKEFIRISNLEDGIVEGIIYSTEFLSKKQIEDVEIAISKKLYKEVVLINRIDTTLIGGIKVIVGDYNFDGSLKNKLNKLNQYLKEVK